MSKVPLPFSNQPVSEWIAQFQQATDANERLRALQAIGSLCSSEQIAELSEKGLADTDAMIRALAAKLAGITTVPLAEHRERRLVELLVDSDPDVRFEAARALIRRQAGSAATAIPALFAFLDEDETQDLMLAAVLNLLVDANLESANVGDELKSRIMRLLDHERAEVREAVSCVLAKWPQLAVPLVDRLVAWLDDSEPVVREKIARTLGRAGVVNPAILAGLQTASQDEDPEVAREATEALLSLNDR